MEVGGVMDYDYLSSIVSNYTNLSALGNKIGSAIGTSSIKDVMNTLSSRDSFSGILSDATEAVSGLAGVNASTGIEKEARTDLIMQNYITASILKDTLQNSLTGSGDFTQSLFSGLALGGDDSSNSTLSSLQDSTLSAISNMEAYADYLNKQVG